MMRVGYIAENPAIVSRTLASLPPDLRFTQLARTASRETEFCT